MSLKRTTPEDPAEAALSRAGRAFDAQEVAGTGDDALAARMAEHAIAAARGSRAKALPLSAERSTSTKQGPLARLRNRGVIVAAAVGFAATGAAAAGGYVVLSRAPAPATVTPLAVPSVKRGVPAPLRQLAGASAAAPPSQPSTSAEPPAYAEPPAPVDSAPARLHEKPLTPESLFSKGNAERRAGKTTEAVGTYELLLSRFGGSSEAQMARVSLGNVLLAQGRAGQALAVFDSHLSRGSQLGAEALYGKARALRALGKPSEEREVWKILATKYPDSIYARSAQR